MGFMRMWWHSFKPPPPTPLHRNNHCFVQDCGIQGEHARQSPKKHGNHGNHRGPLKGRHKNTTSPAGLTCCKQKPTQWYPPTPHMLLEARNMSESFCDEWCTLSCHWLPQYCTADTSVITLPSHQNWWNVWFMLTVFKHSRGTQLIICLFQTHCNECSHLSSHVIIYILFKLRWFLYLLRLSCFTWTLITESIDT